MHACTRLCVFARLARRDAHLPLPAVAQDGELDARRAEHGRLDGGIRVDGHSVHGEDQVALEQLPVRRRPRDEPLHRQHLPLLLLAHDEPLRPRAAQRTASRSHLGMPGCGAEPAGAPAILAGVLYRRALFTVSPRMGTPPTPHDARASSLTRRAAHRHRGHAPRRTLLKDENHTPTHIRQHWGAGRRLRDRWKAIASTHMDRPSASSAEVCKRVPAHCAANLTLHATSQGGWHEPQYCVRGRGGSVRGGGSAWGLGVE